MSSKNPRRREEGAALLVAVMMMVLMGMIGLAALETVTQDRQIAGFQTRARAAFYAAEAGVGNSKNLVRTAGERTSIPALATTSLGDTATYPYGRPSFTGDPDFANPVRYVRDGTPWAAGGDLRVGRQRLVNTLWQANVEGDTPDGATARLEAMLSKLLASGYGG
jgi:hypothetical protein